MLLFLHICAGAISLLSGWAAIAAKKGGPLHKKAGLVFVFSMLFMSASSFVLAYGYSEGLDTLGGGLTFYLVATGFLTVRRKQEYSQAMNVIFMLFGAVLVSYGFFSAYTISSALTVIGNNGSTIDGQPIQVLFVFTSVALIATLLDLKSLLKPLNAKQKLLRHIWRMGFAMFMAVTSFFLGQSQVIPEPIRNVFVLVTPILLTILLIMYWLIRVSIRGLAKPLFKRN